MPRETAIEAEGRVIEALPGSIFRVELPNGHRIVAHLSRELRLGLSRVALGDRVKLEMSPFDMSKGRIVVTKSELK